MNIHPRLRQVGLLGAAATLVFTGVLLAGPSAAWSAERLARQPAIVLPSSPGDVVAEPLTLAPECKWNIRYKHHCLGPKCDCCLPPIKMVLQVPEPCGCCLVEVPVCVPGCCTGVPEVDCRRGLFGRHVVTYDWCCGNHLKIVMTKHGDLIVHYFGK